jgi:hypothetical protein
LIISLMLAIITLYTLLVAARITIIVLRFCRHTPSVDARLSARKGSETAPSKTEDRRSALKELVLRILFCPVYFDLTN